MAERGKAGAFGRGAAKGRKAQNATSDQKDRPGDDPFVYTEETPPKNVPIELLPQFVELVKSADPRRRLHGALLVRKLLSVEQNAPIDEVVACDVGPILVQFLRRDDNPKLQFEAAWALTNIAAGLPQHVKYVLSINAAPPLVQLLSSPSEDCKEQAAWALGNLAGDNAKCRDRILSLNVVGPLLRVFRQCGSIGAHRNATWALSNLCKGEPPPDLKKIALAIPRFVSLLSHTDNEIVTDAAWALSYVCDGGTERVQAVLAHSLVPRLVHLLASPTTRLQAPAIRIIRWFVTCSRKQMVIKAGALATFSLLLVSAKRAIREYVCWTLSNILAGTKEQIQAVIDSVLVPPLLNCMFDADFQVKKQAVRAIANLTTGGSAVQVEYLVRVGGLDSLGAVLGQRDLNTEAVALEAIENILRFGERIQADHGLDCNPYAVAVILSAAIDSLEALGER